MRIISGKYKGRHIPVPSSFKARPTTDFAREGLFNILANTWEFEDLAVLDLFAGTGSIGFEFLSRGAGRVDMVETDHKSTRFLQRTATSLGTENVRVFRSDAMKFIRNCFSHYDIVFADPPYDLDIIPELVETLLEADILEDEGWFILEHGKTNSFSDHSRFLELRKYGSVHFSFFI
ncbi:16S rRNA (guanine(966)-N(2))-methyltransferase RsmD [Bacteroidota bacterium]